MTIASQISKSGPFACNGVTTVFPGGFALIDASHVSVILTNPDGAETVLTLGTHYSVSGVGGPTFSVTISPARPAGYAVTLIRNVPFTQETDLESQGAYFAEVVEAAFDAAVARDQQLKELIDRSVKIPASADIADLDSLVADIVQLGDRVEAVEAVAAIAPHLTTVAGVADAVTTVAGIAPAVSTVGAAASQVSAVATNLSTISAVAANATNINAASGHAASASASASAASASAIAAAASAATTTPVPVQINAATDTAFVDADMLPARKASDGSLIKRSWGNVKAALSSLFVSHSSAQALTAAQAGQARANIGADLLGGYRNKIINGDFDIWQRGASMINPSGSSYISDRWTTIFNGTGATRTYSRQPHTIGQSDVPGNPKHFLRFEQSVAGSGGTANYILQRIEGVSTLAGKTATFTFYARSLSSPVVMPCAVLQLFGSGGSPSPFVSQNLQTANLTTNWQKFTSIVTLPSISGKTLGTNGDDALAFYFLSPPNALFTIDISHVSVVEGDATTEADPFSPRNVQQELMLCQRYYCKSTDANVEPADGIGNLRYNACCWSTTLMNSQTIFFPVEMRAPPAITFYKPGFTGLAGTAARWQWFDPPTYKDSSATVATTTTARAFVPEITVSGATARSSYLVRGDWSASAEI